MRHTPCGYTFSFERTFIQIKIKLMKKIIYILLTFISVPLIGQNFNDALRYSDWDRIGSARSLGVGNSNSAVGGDAGAVLYNPAGLAFYRHSEIHISQGIKTYNPNISNNTNPLLSDTEIRYNLPQFSVVITEVPDHTRWKQTNYGVSYSRLADFGADREFTYTGDRSISHHFAELSNGRLTENLDDYLGGLAYDSYLTVYEEDDQTYSTDLARGEQVNTRRYEQRCGGLSELAVSGGGNYNNKLFLGATASLSMLHYKSTIKHVESSADNEIFNSLRLRENLEVNGTGFNLRVGAIYAPIPQVQIGLALHSPTWLQLNEEYDTKLTYDYNNINDLFPEDGPKENLSPLGEFEYLFRTPWRANAGLAIKGKLGFISADVEYANYGSARFNSTELSDEDFEAPINRDIKDNLDEVFTYKVGGELAIKDVRLRAGVQYRQHAPLAGSGNESIAYSAGVGVWFGPLYIDGGFRHRETESSFAPYLLDDNSHPSFSEDLIRSDIVLAVGYKF